MFTVYVSKVLSAGRGKPARMCDYHRRKLLILLYMKSNIKKYNRPMALLSINMRATRSSGIMLTKFSFWRDIVRIPIKEDWLTET